MRSVRIDPEKWEDMQEIKQEISWHSLERFDFRDAFGDAARCVHCDSWFDREKAIDQESKQVCEECYVGK